MLVRDQRYRLKQSNMKLSVLILVSKDGPHRAECSRSKMLATLKSSSSLKTQQQLQAKKLHKIARLAEQNLKSEEMDSHKR